MNKGVEIRDKKLHKNAAKRNVLKPDQENLCQFVTIRYQFIERLNGKYKHSGSETVNGLQIKNRVYLASGSYKLINNKGVKVLKRYEGIPEWASVELIEKYNEANNLVQEPENTV